MIRKTLRPSLMKIWNWLAYSRICRFNETSSIVMWILLPLLVSFSNILRRATTISVMGGSPSISKPNPRKDRFIFWYISIYLHAPIYLLSFPRKRTYIFAFLFLHTHLYILFFFPLKDPDFVNLYICFNLAPLHTYIFAFLCHHLLLYGKHVFDSCNPLQLQEKHTL